MYEALAEFYAERGLIYAKLSSVRQYDLLLEFAETRIPQDDVPALKEILLSDFFRSDRSDLPPVSLREIWHPERSRRAEANAVLQGKDYRKTDGYEVRFTASRCYIMNYRARHPVTGQYPCESCEIPAIFS